MSQKNGNDASPAVETAKYIAGREQEPEPIKLPSGDVVVITPVSATLIDEVVSRVKNPIVPTWHNPDKDRDEPNPLDPEYLRGIEEAERKRGIAAMDAMIMFGVTLINGLPDNDTWLKKLRVMEKAGHVNLAAYDLGDDIDMEFLYKRFILSDAKLLNLISNASGITEDVERAERSFQS